MIYPPLTKIALKQSTMLHGDRRTACVGYENYFEINKFLGHLVCYMS